MIITPEMKLMLKLHQESQRTKLIFFFVIMTLIIETMFLIFWMWVLAFIIGAGLAVFGKALINNILKRDHERLIEWINGR